MEAQPANSCFGGPAWANTDKNPEETAVLTFGVRRKPALFETASSSGAHTIANISHAGGGAGTEKVRGVARDDGPYSVVEATLADAPELAFMHGESVGAIPPDDPHAPEGPYTKPGWTSELIEMRKAALQSAEGVARKRREIAKAQGNPNELYLLAKNEKGFIVGFGWGIRGAEEAALNANYVHPRYWRQGIGFLLVRAVLDWSDPELPLTVATTPTHPSVLFYQRSGFEIVPGSEHRVTVGAQGQVWQVKLVHPPRRGPVVGDGSSGLLA
jgi:GNAT superfamily N-acetyltransferase